MYLDALQKESLKNAGAEQRYLLLRLMLESKNRSAIEGPVRVLAERFQVSPRAATRLFRILEKEGYMTSQLLSSGRRGRPCTEWSVSESFSSRYVGPASKHIYQLSLVEQLLSSPLYRTSRGSTSKPAPKPKPTLLRVQTKLVLIALLLNADVYGVVRGVGLSRLGKLSGMGKSNVQSQLDVLLAQGYIHSLFPGVTSTHLFGKVESIYFLNLRHDCYGGKKAVGATFIILDDNDHRIPESDFVSQLFFRTPESLKEEWVHYSWLTGRKVDLALPCPCEKLGLIRPFLEKKRMIVFVWLWVESWVSDLLSKYWKPLESNDGMLERNLLPKILNILFPPHACIKRHVKGFRYEKKNSTFPVRVILSQEEMHQNHEDGKFLLSSLLLRFSIQMAKDIQQLLTSNVTGSLSQCTFRIMPYLASGRGGVRPYANSHTLNQRFSLVIEIAGGEFQSYFLLLRQDQNRNLHYEPRDNLDMLTLEQQYNFGLKALPRISKVAKIKSRRDQKGRKEERPKVIPVYHL